MLVLPREDAMRLLVNLLEILAVIVALCLWGLVPEILSDYGYPLASMAAFILIPLGLLRLGIIYQMRRRKPLAHRAAAVK